MLAAIRQAPSGLWVGRTGGYIAVASSKSECHDKLYPNRNNSRALFIGMDELEAIRVYLNEEKQEESKN